MYLSDRRFSVYFGCHVALASWVQDSDPSDFHLVVEEKPSFLLIDAVAPFSDLFNKPIYCRSLTIYYSR